MERIIAILYQSFCVANISVVLNKRNRPFHSTNFHVNHKTISTLSSALEMKNKAKRQC